MGCFQPRQKLHLQRHPWETCGTCQMRPVCGQLRRSVKVGNGLKRCLFQHGFVSSFLHPWDASSPGCEMMMPNASKHLGHPLLIEHFFAGIWWPLSNPLSCYIHMLIVPVSSEKSNVPSRCGSRLDRQKKSIKRITAVIWHFPTQPHAQVWSPKNHFSSSNTFIE
jgi:hypothetical protein